MALKCGSSKDSCKELAQTKGKAIMPAEVVALPQLLVSHNRGSMQYDQRLTAELNFLRRMDEEIVGKQITKTKQGDDDGQRASYS